FVSDNSAVVAGFDGVARVWELPVDRGVGVALPHVGPVTRVAFSDDGKVLLTASEKGAWLRHGDTGAPFRGPLLPGPEPRRSAGLSPDGRRLALTGWARNTVEVQETATGRDRLTSPRHARHFTGVAFSPDSRRLLALSEHMPNQPAELRWWEVGG